MFKTQKSQVRIRSTHFGALMLVTGVIAGIAIGGVGGVIAVPKKSSKIVACANKATGAMRYSKSAKCAKTESKVSWNLAGTNGTPGAKGETGTAGAKGETGTAGAKGETGAAGTNGTNATVAITQLSTCGTGGTSLCKVGAVGPGGGFIFFVDYNDQYTGFDYLEAAPSSCEGSSKAWSSDTTHSLVAVNGWAARAVGAGKANSAAMIASGATSYVGDTSGAAFFAEGSTCGTKTDWFLGSLGEMKLMYDNLQGVGGFAADYYWSSSENLALNAWLQGFVYGFQNYVSKNTPFYVRPVRAF
ncbi:MAG: hypothetical protein NTU52_09545 [Actinobacteria bacterium]|nr:hypothetical protein [Actinomycetota bacterium]